MTDRETYDGIYKTIADIVFEKGLARTQSTSVYLDGNGHVGITYSTGAMHITDKEYCLGSNMEINVFDTDLNKDTVESLKDMLLILHSDAYERYGDVEVKTNTWLSKIYIGFEKLLSLMKYMKPIITMHRQHIYFMMI